MTDPIAETNTIDSVYERVMEATNLIRKNTKFTSADGNLVITLEFKDEVDLAQQWMTMLADCKFLLRQLGRDMP